MNQKKALCVIDVQNDFCPGGALPVPEGDKVVPLLNRAIALFFEKGFPVFASRDWHPRETSHFKAFGGPWPAHCVRETSGAAFHPDLEISEKMIIISKGMDADAESYSVFSGIDKEGRSFADRLNESGIVELYVGGLATDYCVRQTCLDALGQGFQVFLLTDAVRGVDVTPGDSEKAIKEIARKGGRLLTLDEIEKDWEK